jgi:hypothetical protein
MSNCVKAIPRSAVNIYNLFKDIIYTNAKSPDGIRTLYSKENIDWACKIWIKNYDNLRKNPDTFYMTLVLLNRKSLCGKFSLVYNDNIYKSIKDKKEKDLIKLYSNPYFNELYDNKELTKEEKNGLEIILKKEMLAINFYIKKLENMSKIPENFLESEEYKECFYQIHQTLNIHISRQDIQYINTSVVDYITISEYNENSDSQFIMYYDILNLLSLIYFDENNTYTNKPFNVNTINSIKKKYEFEMKLLKRAYGDKFTKK